MKLRTTALMTAFMIFGLLISACGGGEAEMTATPTLDPKAIETNAVATFANGLTQTALAAPTNTPTATSTVAPSPTIGTLTIATSTAASGITTSCYGMTFVNDVNIPDNTVMTPGQTFTKTWKVRNTGTCAWDAGFQFSFTGGNAMSGTTFTLPQSVAVNTETDISVALTAPGTAGTSRGNWRMSTSAGQFFGDEVYVQIVVSGTDATSIPATATVTPTATP